MNIIELKLKREDYTIRLMSSPALCKFEGLRGLLRSILLLYNHRNFSKG